MAPRRGTNIIPIGNQKVIEVGGGLTLTSTYNSGARGQKTESFILTAAAGATCPAPMTRVALITLRNASGLSKDCDYVITDHVQGRLVAGTQIHLQAVSANKLSENVQVDTPYDNEAWRGIYDLDRGLVLELQDNRNNIARGINGTEVSNFDWGNTAITDTTVDNGVWTSTIGSPRIVNNLTVKKNATLNTTGWLGGSITGGTVIEGFATNVNMTNANVSLLVGRFSDATSFNLSGFTAGSTINRYNLNSCNFNFSNSTSPVSLSIVTAVGSTLNHIGVTTGTITGSNLVMDGTTVITHSNGAGNLSLNRVTLSNQGNINHSAGVVALSDYQILNGAFLLQSGAGNISLSSGQMSGQANIINQSIVNFNGTRYSAFANGIVNANTGAVGTVTLTGTTNNSGQIIKTATSTSGNMNITTSVLGKSSIIQQSGTGAVFISDTELSSNSRVTVSNTRGLSILRGEFRNLTQIIQSGTTVVNDSIVDSECATRATLTISSSGAIAHTFNYCKVEGSGANLTISGTSTGQTLNRVRAIDSSYTFSNNTVANTFSNMLITDGCTATIQNLAVTKTFNNVQLDNSSVLNVNAPSVAGTIQGISARDNAGININGTAGAGNGIYAKERGIVTFNGGSCTDISKQMNGTLTTGNFIHNNVVVINPISVALTANNSNKASYLGVNVLPANQLI